MNIRIINNTVGLSSTTPFAGITGCTTNSTGAACGYSTIAGNKINLNGSTATIGIYFLSTIGFAKHNVIRENMVVNAAGTNSVGIEVAGGIAEIENNCVATGRSCVADSVSVGRIGIYESNNTPYAATTSASVSGNVIKGPFSAGAISASGSGLTSIIKYNLIIGAPLNNTVPVSGKGVAINDLTSPHRVAIFDNIVVGVKYPLHLYGDKSGAVIELYNNTIAGFSEGLHIDPSVASTIVYSNNIMAWLGRSSKHVCYVSDNIALTGNLKGMNNLYYVPNDPNVDWELHHRRFTRLSAWHIQTGADANSLTSNPEFTNYSKSVLTIQTGSPAIGAGVNLGLPFNSRLLPASIWPGNVIAGTQSPTWNMGAY
jgi:hypothetical protein